MKILITGGNGFVGSHIVKHISLGHTVFAPSSNILDLTKLESVNKWFDENEIDIVIHCALSGREILSSTDPIYLSDGLLMFRNLWLHRKKFKKFINLGTAYECDLTVNNENIIGDDILNNLPTTSYGYSKNIIARIIRETDNFYNLRLFGVFHESEKPNRFLSKIKNDNEIIINNDIFLDYIYLPDIFPMIDAIIERHIQNYDINIVYNTKYQLSTLAYMLCDYCNLPTSKIKIKNLEGNNLTGDGTIFESYKFNLIGIEQGIRNYK